MQSYALCNDDNDVWGFAASRNNWKTISAPSLSRLNDFFVIILFAIHKFSFSVVVTFLLSSFFTSGNFWRLCHGGWKSNFHAALRFECCCKNARLFRTIFKPCELSLFFPFPCKIEVRKAAAKEIVFACLVVILFKHCCFSSSLCLSKSSSDIFNYRTSL